MQTLPIENSKIFEKFYSLSNEKILWDLYPISHPHVILSGAKKTEQRKKDGKILAFWDLFMRITYLRLAHEQVSNDQPITLQHLRRIGKKLEQFHKNKLEIKNFFK